MASVLFLPQPVLPASLPSSPDPSPLRLLAFSVAEAALQSDPNSPSLALHSSNRSRATLEGDWSGPWSVPCANGIKTRHASFGAESRRAGERLWDVVEHARERRVRTPPAPRRVESAAPSSEVSSASYKFVLPANSPLAASIAASPEKRSPATPPRLSAAARQTLNARLRLSSLGKDARPFPLFTRSAEPSPTKSTFSTLDQSRPPPVFVPRFSDGDSSKQETAPSGRSSPLDRLPSQAPRSPVASSRHTARLPSLAQIQAKMSKTGHRRGTSVDGIPAAVPGSTVCQAKGVYRTNSNESVEVLKTPTDEMPPSQPRTVTASPERRPQTPPSPTGSNKESRLAPFLRERTSGRLAGGGSKSRPVSMPPLSGFNLNLLAFAGKDAKGNLSRAAMSPPRSAAAQRGPTSSATVPPPSPCRQIILNTPPNRYTATVFSSPASPTDSARSRCSTASPTLSVPIITCTPAPARFVRDGVEHDSDEEGGDVVLFEGECIDDDEAKEREERERRGKQMLERLTLRRRSD